MTRSAILFDATGEDREVELQGDGPIAVDDDRLLWIDLDARDGDDLARAARAIGLEAKALDRLSREDRRARFLRLTDRVVLTLGTVDPDDPEVTRHELDVVIGPNQLLTVHDGPIPAIDAYREELSGEDRAGSLDAAAFAAGLIDHVLTDFFRQLEAIEREIDRLDEVAIRTRSEGDFLGQVLVLRRRIARLRRVLSPNREALLPLERQDIARTEENVGTAWTGMGPRLERAIDGIENARELLVGSFDLYLGRSSQRTNDVMKVLTIISALALPGVVLAGVMGMNFKLPFFDDPNNFFVVAGVMIGFAAVILAISRWRHWI